MKLVNLAKRYGAKLTAVGGVMALPALAAAAVPEEVTQSLATAKTDSVTVAGVVLGIIVALFGFRMMRRSLN